MKKHIHKVRLVLAFLLLLIATEGKALKNTIKSSLNSKENELDKRISDVRKKIKGQLKDADEKKTTIDFKKYSRETEWINWGNWGNWNNWNNWANWDKWTNWSNQWSNFVNS